MNLHYRRGPEGPAKKFSDKDEQRYKREAGREPSKEKANKPQRGGKR